MGAFCPWSGEWRTPIGLYDTSVIIFVWPLPTVTSTSLKAGVFLQDGEIPDGLLQNPFMPTFLGFPFFLYTSLPASQACFPSPDPPAQQSPAPHLPAQEEATGMVELRRFLKGCPGQNPYLIPSSPKKVAPNGNHPSFFHLKTWSKVGPAWKRHISKTNDQECKTVGQNDEEQEHLFCHRGSCAYSSGYDVHIHLDTMLTSILTSMLT